MPTKFPRIKDGDELQPFHLNLIYAELDRWRGMKGSGIVDVDGAEGGSQITIVGYDYGRTLTSVAKSGAGGIAALSGSTPGSNTVTLYTFGGSTLAAAGAVTAYNLSSTAVAATTWLQVKKINGYWFVDFENCP